MSSTKTSLPKVLNYAEHAADIVSKAVDLIKDGQRFALISSLAIEGGAAREVGSLALVEDSGEMTGYLSNGCIDRDIQFHAVTALEEGGKKLIRYGDGSRFADLKLPCGGALDVLIDPAPDLAAILAAKSSFDARKPATLTFSAVSGATEITRSFIYAPRFRLHLAGRGAIFRALAQAGHASGFEICLMSPDLEDLEAARPLASEYAKHLTSPTQVDGVGRIDAHSAFLTLFHDHDWEPSLLQAALKTDAFFIGSLGSLRTHALRCEALRDMGVSEHDLTRLRGPIGLVPSLRDASFIAVSALAEIVGSLPVTIGALGD